MHLLFRETHDIDAQARAEDLKQEPADIVILSFADSDLSGMLQAHEKIGKDRDRPSLTVANLGRLKHPLSVDVYLEQTVCHAKIVLVRLLGGINFWRYGIEELVALCQERAIRLVVLPGDDYAAAGLKACSFVDDAVWDRLSGFMAQGGEQNWLGALRLLGALIGVGADDESNPTPLPECGVYQTIASENAPLAIVVFYRAHLMAGDVGGVEALGRALSSSGFSVQLVYVASLKTPCVASWLNALFTRDPPDILLNATFFAARGEGGDISPLDQAEVPVFQLLQPNTTRDAWLRSMRGLLQTDLAMQVVLPELDGRLTLGPISFRSDAPPGFPARREVYLPGVMQAVRAASKWVQLAHTPRALRRIVIVLSDYPGAGGQKAHAVGLDGFASLEAIARDLRQAGFAAPFVTSGELVDALCHAEPREILDVPTYRRLFSQLPANFRETVISRWGDAEQKITLRYFERDNFLFVIQPLRGCEQAQKADYHNLDVPPQHAYIGFYLWLRMVWGPHAMVHLGTHGTLEWLPGKSVALTDQCAPLVLLEDLPIIYPFIVNNPGEAAAAKRRIGAVTIGHMSPPICKAGLGDDLAVLEKLIDEYAAAEGLDFRRAEILRKEILRQAGDLGVLAESGVQQGDVSDALAQLDAYLCDVKDLQIRDGLHIFGAPCPRIDVLAQTLARTANVSTEMAYARLTQCPQAERDALIRALDGKFISPGPAGAPTRGRLDVLPTGRNLITMDPRQMPTPSASNLAKLSAERLLTQTLQDRGEDLRHLVLELWASANLRNGGEDIALAFYLLGVKLVWNAENARIQGFEIIPLPELDRPRVDVTLRISGLFRDAFPGLIALFRQAVCALCAREEPKEYNPLSGLTQVDRVFGAAPGSYGTGLEVVVQNGHGASRFDLGKQYLRSSSWVYDDETDVRQNEAAFSSQLARAEVILRVQDHAELDLLDGPDIAAHGGGLQAAAHFVGNAPDMLLGDTSNPENPKMRPMEREIARIVRGRVANPRWLNAMCRHGYNGAAEIARGVNALCVYAMTMEASFDQQFDLIYAALLKNQAVASFLRENNPEAYKDIECRLRMMFERQLWRPRSNSIFMELDA